MSNGGFSVEQTGAPIDKTTAYVEGRVQRDFASLIGAHRLSLFDFYGCHDLVAPGCKRALRLTRSGRGGLHVGGDLSSDSRVLVRRALDFGVCAGDPALVSREDGDFETQARPGVGRCTRAV